MDNYQYAGFWIRFGAVLIDTLILMLIISVPLTLIYGANYWSGEQLVQGVWDLLLSFVLPIAATIWFWVRFSATPGKMALKLKVLDAKTGKKPSMGQSCIRYVGYYVSLLPLMLGFIWTGVDKRKQGFHDKLACTVVVRDVTPEQVNFG
jgi:uncharacterized RDD family membrane protein YckC